MMNNNLDDKLKQLSDILNDPSAQDNLKNILRSFMPSKSPEDSNNGDNLADINMQPDSNINTDTQASEASNDEMQPSEVNSASNLLGNLLQSTTNNSSSNPLGNLSNLNLQNSIEMLSKAQHLIQNLDNASDSRIDLLHAIRPFLGSKRQQYCGTCINLLKLTGIAKIIGTYTKK